MESWTIPGNPGEILKNPLKYLWRIARNPKSSRTPGGIPKNPWKSPWRMVRNPESSQTKSHRIPEILLESKRILEKALDGSSDSPNHPKNPGIILSDPQKSQRILENTLEGSQRIPKILVKLKESQPIQQKSSFNHLKQSSKIPTDPNRTPNRSQRSWNHPQLHPNHPQPQKSPRIFS